MKALACSLSAGDAVSVTTNRDPAMKLILLVVLCLCKKSILIKVW